MSGKPTPVIVIGQTEETGRGVIERLQPEYEVIAFMCTKEACAAEIPAILRGQSPANPSSTIGTGNIAERPVAVILGGGFTSVFDEVHDAVEAACGPEGSRLVWLKNDTEKPGPGVLGAGYPGSVAERVKGVLGDLAARGKIGTGEGDVHWY